jgi:hypothetical protein
MLSQEEKAEQWAARRADDETWGAEQATIRRAKSGELVLIDRARFERLREYVAADQVRICAEAAHGGEAHRVVYERCAAAEQALLPDDTDPLL